MSDATLPPLPLTVIAGYLGSGKTTLINKLLADAGGRRIMVLVNDFGELAIDAELIAARGGDTISLSNGCVCCAIGGDLFQAFAKALDASPRPDHLVIEASGVAEPDRIANFARAEPELRLDLIVTLVDALNARTQADDPLIGRTLHQQFQSAGLLLITKDQLAGQEQATGLASWLSTLCPETPILRGEMDLEILLGPETNPPPSVDQKHPHDHDHSHEDMYERWSFSAPLAPDVEALRVVLENLPTGILRLKGVANSTPEPVEFHTAGRHINITPAPGVTTHGLRVVAIGLAGNLPTDELAARFETLATSA